jgi:hypothetical protein
VFLLFVPRASSRLLGSLLRFTAGVMLAATGFSLGRLDALAGHEVSSRGAS